MNSTIKYDGQIHRPTEHLYSVHVVDQLKLINESFYDHFLLFL